MSALVGEALPSLDPGSNLARDAVSARIAEIMFLVGVRQVVVEDLPSERWASGAFLHPRIGRAVRALHLDPTQKWTVASLAREAAMSRSTFAALFSRLVGEPPLAYLTRLRMQRAVELLREGENPGEVAFGVGYSSVGAFGKAFKRFLGVSPGAYGMATAAARAQSERARRPSVADAPPLSVPRLTQLARIVYDLEQLIPSALCAIMRYDPTDRVLRHGAAPSLPELYNQAIDGVRVGPTTGSCGTAVHRRAPVIVRDIGESPLWSDYRYLAERFRLRACWSKPIFDKNGDVLGTFAVYHRNRHEPSEVELAIADHLAERIWPALAAAR